MKVGQNVCFHFFIMCGPLLDCCFDSGSSSVTCFYCPNFEEVVLRAIVRLWQRSYHESKLLIFHISGKVHLVCSEPLSFGGLKPSQWINKLTHLFVHLLYFFNLFFLFFNLLLYFFTHTSMCWQPLTGAEMERLVYSHVTWVLLMLHKWQHLPPTPTPSRKYLSTAQLIRVL